MTEQRKAWQEPMVWLIAGIPLLTVIAGFYTLYLASNAGPIDASITSVQRIAQAQTLNNSADQFSTENNYHALLTLDKSQAIWSVALKTTPSQLRDSDINIVFVHPQRADQDMTVRMTSMQDSIRMPATIEFKPQQIIVSDTQGKWRLVGIDDGSNNVTLTPVLSTQ